MIFYVKIPLIKEKEHEILYKIESFILVLSWFQMIVISHDNEP